MITNMGMNIWSENKTGVKTGHDFNVANEVTVISSICQYADAARKVVTKGMNRSGKNFTSHEMSSDPFVQISCFVISKQTILRLKDRRPDMAYSVPPVGAFAIE